MWNAASLGSVTQINIRERLLQKRAEAAPKAGG
jgi:hypothetical protein